MAELSAQQAQMSEKTTQRLQEFQSKEESLQRGLDDVRNRPNGASPEAPQGPRVGGMAPSACLAVRVLVAE